MKHFILHLLLLLPLALYAEDNEHLLNGSKEFEEKNFYSLFDSFGESLQWQGILSEISGMNFSKEVNKKTNASGTKTGVWGTSCGMRRAMKLYEMTQRQSVDYIFVENVNDVVDIKNSGDIEDRPFFSMQSQTILPNKKFYKKADAIQYWDDNFQTIVSDVKPNIGQVFSINYYDTLKVGFTIKIKETPKKNGTISCKIGSTTRKVYVDVNMSKQGVVDNILEYCYCAGWTVSQNDSTEVTFNSNKETDSEISLDVGDTGLDFEIKRSNAVIPVPFCFVGSDISEWVSKDSWSSTPSLYSKWKGFISYLKSSFPDTKIYVVIPTYYSFKFSDINNNSEFDYNSINNSARLNIFKLFDLQRNVANYYNIPVIDLEQESGINIYNAQDYYKDNDVHIKNKEGYKLWAEAIYKHLLEDESKLTTNITRDVILPKKETKIYEINGLMSKYKRKGLLISRGKKYIYK